VAGATASNKGGGHRRLVLADKNLVPKPRDNLIRVADILRKSGGGCLTAKALQRLANAVYGFGAA
jgi:hypothetical protein